MVCIQGGPAIVGTDDAGEAERPKHTVEIGTEVTNAEYAQCEKAGVCPHRGSLSDRARALAGSDQPAVPMTWVMAHAFCVWAGKRLPTEAEWEKAARGPDGRPFPWGAEPPSCERGAFTTCTPQATRPVGSFPAGPYGLFDMAGNGFEWVQDWGAACYDGCKKPCGAACLGTNPAGPCDGAPVCEGFGKRVVKGGLWRGDEEVSLSASRRLMLPGMRFPRLSFRCTSSDATLTRAPPLALSDPLPQPPDPSPPTAAELRLFHDITPDTDIMEIKPCRRQGMARLDCRDPMSYIKTNEVRQQVWLPYIRNLGGGYVGLGADQGYSFIAAAHSEWAWLFDYDPTVVRLHSIIDTLVVANETPEQFVASFMLNAAKKTRAELKEAFKTDTEEAEAIDELYRNVRQHLWNHYAASQNSKPNVRDFGWLRTPDNYRYVRLLLQQGRIQVVKGNMLTDRALPSIARSARALGVPVRIYYPSNAEEQWVLTPQYRANVQELPFDTRSVVIRTLIGSRWKGESESYWHYVVQGGIDTQRKMSRPGYRRVAQFMDDRLLTTLPHLSVIRLPGRTEREPTLAVQPGGR